MAPNAQPPAGEAVVGSVAAAPGAGTPTTVTSSSAAAATALPAPSGTAVTPIALAPPGMDWDSDFARAKTNFIAGNFRLATKQFENLALRARTPIEKARVAELLQASAEWTRRDVILIEQRELAGSDLQSRRSDRRTADEIGVLYLSAIGYGLGTGLWLDVQTEPDSVAGYIMPPLLFAGAAVGAVALIDSGKGLRYGTAQSISSGMFTGFIHGLSWLTYYQTSSKYYDEMDGKNYASLLWGTTTIGAVAGGIIGTVNSTTPGRASFVSSATLWPALVLGLAGAGFTSDEHYRDDNALLLSGLGAAAGTIGGVLAAGSVAPTTARVRFLDLGAIGGGLAVGGLALAARAEETKDGTEIFLATDAGILAGLGLAWWLTSGMPRDLGAQTPQPSKVSLTPTLLPQRGGLGLGAVGTF